MFYSQNPLRKAVTLAALVYAAGLGSTAASPDGEANAAGTQAVAPQEREGPANTRMLRSNTNIDKIFKEQQAQIPPTHTKNPALSPMTPEIRSKLMARFFQPQGTERSVYDPKGIFRKMEERKFYMVRKELKELSLEDRLKRISPVEKRVIAIGVNCGYLDFTDNFLSSLLRFGVDNFVIFALDQEAYDELSLVFPLHTHPRIGSTASSGGFASEAFASVVNMRPQMLLSVLNLDYAVMYSDVDIVWNENIWPEFDGLSQYDIVAPQDIHPKMDYQTFGDHFCTGLIYMQPTRETKNAMELWTKRITKNTNQAPFNLAIKELKKKRQIKIVELNRDAFPPGFAAFGDEEWRQRFSYEFSRDPVWIHNNWIIGHTAKKERFILNDLWNPLEIFNTHDVC